MEDVFVKFKAFEEEPVAGLYFKSIRARELFQTINALVHNVAMIGQAQPKKFEKNNAIRRVMIYTIQNNEYKISKFSRSYRLGHTDTRDTPNILKYYLAYQDKHDAQGPNSGVLSVTNETMHTYAKKAKRSLTVNLKDNTTNLVPLSVSDEPDMDLPCLYKLDDFKLTYLPSLVHILNRVGMPYIKLSNANLSVTLAV